MRLVVGGEELVTGDEVQRQLGDVSPARLRGWARSTPWRGPLLRPLTVGELAWLVGVEVPAGRDPDALAVERGRPGSAANLYRWRDVVEVERTLADRLTPAE